MSGKLDKSLDEILSTQRRSAGRRVSGRRSSGRPATTAPVGGIHKNTRDTRKTAAKPNVVAKATGATGNSKIVVSNMPRDVSEQQIKEYFSKAVGPVRKVDIAYDANRNSRGTATVTFSHVDGATKAFDTLNGLLIDDKPMKIEVIVSSADQIPQPKTLSQRVTQPKVQPKSAATDKGKGVAKGNGAGATAKGARKANPRRGRNARPAKKTAEELDSEMADYFQDNSNTNANTNEAVNGSAPAAPAGDAAMDDEIL